MEDSATNAELSSENIAHSTRGDGRMLYHEYVDLKSKYRDAQKVYDAILTEKEEVFQRTQPQAVNGKEKVSGGKSSNMFDRYLIEIQEKQIDERLAEAKKLLSERDKLLRIKRDELRASNDIRDKIYLSRYIERRKVYQIAQIVNYSERQVLRILSEIRETLR